MAHPSEAMNQTEPMAKRSEIKVYEEHVLGSRNAFWYHDYITLVQKLEKEDPTFQLAGDMTKAQLKRKLAGFIAYR